MATIGRPVGWRADNTLEAQAVIKRLKLWKRPKLDAATVLKVQSEVHAKGYNVPAYQTVVTAHRDVRTSVAGETLSGIGLKHSRVTIG
jgi:hypothetical protein